MSNATPTFKFGKNWQNYIEKIDPTRISAAKISLCNMLGKTDLKDLRFLDAGCGSGLFSLSAIELEAEEVVSFDVDKDSTECAHLLNNKYGPFRNWKILEGNALDVKWMTELKEFDVVYSWGVLHHTGAISSNSEFAIAGSYWAKCCDHFGSTKLGRGEKPIYCFGSPKLK